MAIKILSVDDEVDLELLLSQYFRRKIRHGEYEFFFAHNGIEALEELLKHPDIEIILSDINMPEMDGLTLLSKINEMRNPAQKCIMVSAYGDLGNIRTAMNNGAFDFATKPIDLDDLQRTIDNAVKQIEFIKSSQKEHAELEDIHNDLEAARSIQHAILPRNFVVNVENASSIDLHASMVTAKEVGGDFYDFFRIDDNHMGFTLADVSGKGVPASLFMAVSRTMIKAYGSTGVSSRECMEKVNDLLSEESLNSMFVTTFYGILDTRNGHIDYTNAGHNNPYVVRADGSVTALPSERNIALGAIGGMSYRSNELTLEHGDLLYMYTDGVPEAEDLDHGQFGESRLEEVLASLSGSSSKTIVDTMNEKVKEFAGEAVQSDDITQLSIKRL